MRGPGLTPSKSFDRSPDVDQSVIIILLIDISQGNSLLKEEEEICNLNEI